MIYSELYTILSGNAALTALTGLRIYPDVAPQKVTVPYIVTNLINVDRSKALQQDSKVALFDYAFACYSTSREGSKQVSEQVRAILQNYVGGNIKATLIDNEFDAYDNQQALYASNIEFKFYFNET